MPLLNDFGDAGVARVERVLQDFAARLGVQKEVLYGFFNETGHLPQTLGELEQWGNRITKYGVSRRDPATGAWTPIMPGVNPDPRLTAQDRGGFPHYITNAEDSQVQRFQQVDPSGNIWGGSWDPAYNAAHPGGGPGITAGGSTTRSAQGAESNPYPPGTPDWVAYETANPSNQPRNDVPPPDPPLRPGVGMPPTRAATGSTGMDAGAATRMGIVDATAYGNTQDLQARIDDAIRRYALARNEEERQQAFLDLQRWQTELKKVQNDQARYDAMAQALLGASVTLSSQPKDYYRFNQYTSGGRDIFAQMQQAGPAFGGTTGPIEPGSVDDLLRRLGIGPSPATPATPAGVQVGAANPSLPGVPYVPVPGAAGGPPGALQPGATGGAGGRTAQSALPSHAERLRELDQAAGGSWGGNRADPRATADAWWQADPARRGTPLPAWT